MAHPGEETIRRAYTATNPGDLTALASEFTRDAVWHGSESSISGAQAIARLVGHLREASGGTLRIELHDVLAKDEHAVALQTTRPVKRLGENGDASFGVADDTIAGNVPPATPLPTSDVPVTPLPSPVLSPHTPFPPFDVPNTPSPDSLSARKPTPPRGPLSSAPERQGWCCGCLPEPSRRPAGAAG